MELPLFPIGEIVLLPGMGLPIYVFEPKYRELLGRIRASGEPFGIPCVLPSNSNSDAASTKKSVQLAQMGTLAHLTEVNYNNDGSAEIIVIGGDRYRILDVNHTRFPYAVASVKLEPLEPSNPTWVHGIAQNVMERFLNKVRNQFGDVSQDIPEDPLLKASFVAANLRLNGEQGQRVLEARNLMERFEIISDYLGVEHRTLN